MLPPRPLAFHVFLSLRVKAPLELYFRVVLAVILYLIYAF